MLPNNKTETPIQTRTHVAGGAIVADTFVKTSQAIVQCVAGDNALGVAKMDGATGDLIAVVCDGDTLVTSGAAIAADALVQADASGFAITKAAGATLGRALTATTGAAQKVLVALIPN